MKTSSWLLALLLLSGCIEELDPASLVNDNRVLGARVTVLGDEAQTQPAPGETAVARFFVVDETDPRPVSFALAACVRGGGIMGRSFCAGAPIALEVREEPTLDPPEIEVDVPSAEVLAGADALLVLGVVCGGGTLAFDITDIDSARCEADGVEAKATSLTLTVSVRAPGAPGNLNPEFLAGDDALSLEGMPWLPRANIPSASCRSAATDRSLPLVSTTTPPLPILLPVPDAARDAFVRDDGTDARETLTIAHFATAGDLERQFEVIDDDEPPEPLEWTPPAIAPEDGLTVRFFITARDGRGGFEGTTRALCLVP